MIQSCCQKQETQIEISFVFFLLCHAENMAEIELQAYRGGSHAEVSETINTAHTSSAGWLDTC